MMNNITLQIDYEHNKILCSEVYNNLKKELKPNPNNWIIIEKWNYRVFKKYENELYKVVEEWITKAIEERIKEAFNSFVDIKEL